MKINLKNGKSLSATFPFRFFDDKAEWEDYDREFPDIVATAVNTPEDRFKGNSIEVFKKAVEYIPRSLIGRPYQYWMAHKLIALLSEENKSRILDYGCGAGNMGFIFAHAGFQVDFAEVKGVITDFLQWRVEKHFLGCKVFSHENDLGEAQYDLVCMQNVMEHLDTPLEVLQKLVRAMSKGAYFLITFNTSGKGLDVVSQETYNTILLPYLLENFNVVEDTDLMLYQKK